MRQHASVPEKGTELWQSSCPQSARQRHRSPGGAENDRTLVQMLGGALLLGAGLTAGTLWVIWRCLDGVIS